MNLIIQCNFWLATRLEKFDLYFFFILKNLQTQLRYLCKYLCLNSLMIQNISWQYLKWMPLYAFYWPFSVTCQSLATHDLVLLKVTSSNLLSFAHVFLLRAKDILYESKFLFVALRSIYLSVKKSHAIIFIFVWQVANMQRCLFRLIFCGLN